MATLTRKIAALRMLPPRAAAGFLKSAWTHAGTAERAVLLEALFSIADDHAAAHAVRLLHIVPPRAAESIARRIDRPLNAAARLVLAQRDASGTRNLILCIRARLDLQLVQHLPELLTAPYASSLRSDAATGLLEIVIGRMGRHGNGAISDSDRGRIERALIAAGQTYDDHRRSEIILALAVALRRAGPVLREWGGACDSAARLALLRLCRRSDISLVRENLLRWWTDPVLSRAALRACCSSLDHESLESILAQSHLLYLPAWRRAARRIDRPLRLLPGDSRSRQMGPAAQAGLAMLIGALDLTPQTRANRLGRMRAAVSAAARCSALRETVKGSGDAAAVTTITFAFDEHPRIARIAAARLMSRGDSRARFADHAVEITRAASRSAAMLATPAAASRDPRVLFDRIKELSPSARNAAARTLYVRSRGAFVVALRDSLENSSVEARMAAVELARRLAIEHEIELELLLQAASSDARIAATATAALAGTRSEAADRALRLALRHPDARVRANALEAGLTRIGSPSEMPIEPHLESPHARLRANALLAWLRTHAGELDRFEQMVSDPRAAHRISAAWVAGRLRCSGLRPRVLELGACDPDPTVRRRAVRAARLLAGSSREGLTVLSAGHPAPAQAVVMHRVEGFTNREMLPGFDAGWVAFAVGCTLAILLIVNWMRRRDRARLGREYRIFSRAIGIARADQRLLARVARRAAPPALHPAALLLSADCFDAACRIASLSARDVARLRVIRRRVFP